MKLIIQGRTESHSRARRIIFFIIVLIIIILTRLLSLWSEQFTFRVIIIGAMLAIATIMLSYLFGLLGAIIAVVSNLISATANYILYFHDYNNCRITTAIFLSAFVVSNLLIGCLSESQHRRESYLIKKSNIDALTQVFNHGYFIKRLHEMIENCNKKNESLFLVLLDIDYFKNTNDYFGHKVGDQVLIAFSDIITGSVRKEDQVFRYGGDEFIILIPNTQLDTCKDICNEILTTFNKYSNCGISKSNSEFKITASAGISYHYPDSKDTDADILHQADIALYESKQTGRNKFTVYNKNIDKNNN